jgi:DNA-binding transcriptional MerR regulator/effector-binding domain-containing protein
MRSSLAIGDFARATQMSIKTLRHYHRIGLLAPAEVDPATGYRYYRLDQIPTAQVIRRFRALAMPLDQIGAVIAAADVGTRNELIAIHLRQLQSELARTQSAVASLRGLLDQPASSAGADIRHRRIAAAPAAAITAAVDLADIGPWYSGALGELHATLAAQRVRPDGSPGGVFPTEFFAGEHGQVTIFIPSPDPVRPTGRVAPFVVPAVELAVIEHQGAHDDIDLAYGALASYVTEHALAVDGPIREYYLVARQDTGDESRWRTEIGWPIFRTGL